MPKDFNRGRAAIRQLVLVLCVDIPLAIAEGILITFRRRLRP